MDKTHRSLKLNFSHIAPHTRQAMDVLSKQSWLKDKHWYLAGGTALTLQFDHRASIDLDFFNPKKGLDLVSITDALSPDWVTTNQRKDTLYGELKKTKVSFIAYPYFVPKKPFITYGNISVLDAKDIAVMKVITISQRGKKRDFFDLYWYVSNREPLIEVLKKVDDQFPNLQHNYHHIIKSLTYFAEAEEDPNPKIYFNATWDDVKKYFIDLIPEVADEFL